MSSLGKFFRNHGWLLISLMVILCKTKKDIKSNYIVKVVHNQDAASSENRIIKS